MLTVFIMSALIGSQFEPPSIHIKTTTSNAQHFPSNLYIEEFIKSTDLCSNTSSTFCVESSLTNLNETLNEFAIVLQTSSTKLTSIKLKHNCLTHVLNKIILQTSIRNNTFDNPNVCHILSNKYHGIFLDVYATNLDYDTCSYSKIHFQKLDIVQKCKLDYEQEIFDKDNEFVSSAITIPFSIVMMVVYIIIVFYIAKMIRKKCCRRSEYTQIPN